MVRRLDYLPWEYPAQATDADRAEQAERHRELAGRMRTELAPDAYVAESAAVYCDELRLGTRSYVAAHAYLTGDVRIGTDSTVNPFAAVRGRIRIGDGVRIGAHSSLLAFNHGTSPDQPIFRQPHTAEGITVGDDVWIGSNVTVLDGVTIGAHSIVGAGAVVTRDVPEWSVAVGNPARVVRNRRAVAPAPTGDLAARLERFAARAREQADDVLARCFDGEVFVDRPGAAPAIRPWCDAIEISDLLLRRVPSGHTRNDLVTRLRHNPDVTGPANYHVLCVGYALDLLGSGFEHPIAVSMDLDVLPWARNAWTAGANVDALGTAIAWNLKNHGDSTGLNALIGWLTINVDPATGAWGKPHPDDGLLQVVNGFYRLTRGTYAQFGLPLPYPEQAVRTVLAHAQDSRVAYNACNVLDVIHPLWLARKQTTVGQAEATRWAEPMLARVLDHWVDGQGFAFGEGDEPGLQGTEMWLAIVWLLADYLGGSDALGYRPRGVHRPEPLFS